MVTAGRSVLGVIASLRVSRLSFICPCLLAGGPASSRPACWTTGPRSVVQDHVILFDRCKRPRAAVHVRRTERHFNKCVFMNVCVFDVDVHSCRMSV